MRKTDDLKRMESRLHGLGALNHRQQALVSHALRHPDTRYTIESHRVSHNVTYETARTDLLNLRDKGLFDGAKKGKTWMFQAAPDLDQALRSLKE